MGTPRLLIAGTHSGVGKTTISTGIMAALANRGLKVQGFKVGPDYIDPSYHTAATGRVSRNLDVWLLGNRLVPSFERAASGADIAIIEGVMGLFDGIKGQGAKGSPAEIALMTEAPVILVMDVRAMGYSTAALLHGFATFDSRVNIAGVILNRIGSASHLAMVKESIASLGVPVVGWLGKDEQLTLPERHLGLVPFGENDCQNGYFTHLARVMEQGLNLDRLLQLANKSKARQQGANIGCCDSSPADTCRVKLPVTIAVARDEAFSFYYQDGLDVLSDAGAKIVYFSPLHDRKLPLGTQGVFIGGGFPEQFLPGLAANNSMYRSLQWAHGQRIPIYAECGGLMYLCEKITDFDDNSFSGVGLVPAESRMTRRLQGMGYREGTLQQDCMLGLVGTKVHGHEFHYSTTEYSRQAVAYRLTTANGLDKGLEGYVANNLFASYLHLNFAGYPELAINFLRTCATQGGGMWASR